MDKRQYIASGAETDTPCFVGRDRRNPGLTLPLTPASAPPGPRGQGTKSITGVFA